MRGKSWVRAALLLAVTGAQAACAGNPRANAPGHSIAPPDRIPAPRDTQEVPPGTPVASSAMPREVRRAVVADAARRFRVAESAVVLTRAEQVTWPNSALGCPEPHRMYSQVLVSGFRVVARTTAGEMLYHTDTRGQVVICAPTVPARDR